MVNPLDGIKLDGIKFFIKELSIYFSMAATLIIFLIIISPLFFATLNIALIKYSLDLRQKHLGWILLTFFIFLTYDLAYVLKAAHTNHIKKKKEKTEKEQKKQELKAQEDRKIQLIKTLTLSQKKILMRYGYENRIQGSLRNLDVEDMIEKKILKVVGLDTYGKFNKMMMPVSIKIEYWALVIIQKYPKLLC